MNTRLGGGTALDSLTTTQVSCPIHCCFLEGWFVSVYVRCIEMRCMRVYVFLVHSLFALTARLHPLSHWTCFGSACHDPTLIEHAFVCIAIHLCSRSRAPFLSRGAKRCLLWFGALRERRALRMVTSASLLDQEDRQWMFSLTKTNMSSFIEDWDDGQKWLELESEEARYLLVLNHHEKPVAFAHVRYLLEECPDALPADDPDAVSVLFLYVWEIHVDPAARSLGVGSALMKLIASMAAFFRMQKVALTVQKKNHRALEWYRRLGYTEDTDCPSQCDAENAHEYDYLILSRSTQVRQVSL
mmetsp:Transcript_14517/g.43609  ORF Transcript_14517/g.43609 Transcript_14517/m.43609 type:complete len:300 (-) Transcript_14517:24-923(-)